MWSPGCKNKACSDSWPKVIKGMSNQGVVCFVTWGSFSVSILYLGCVRCCFFVFGCQYRCNQYCLESLVSKPTYYVSSGMLNLTHSLSVMNFITPSSLRLTLTPFAFHQNMCPDILDCDHEVEILELSSLHYI